MKKIVFLALLILSGCNVVNQSGVLDPTPTISGTIEDIVPLEETTTPRTEEPQTLTMETSTLTPTPEYI